VNRLPRKRPAVKIQPNLGSDSSQLLLCASFGRVRLLMGRAVEEVRELMGTAADEVRELVDTGRELMLSLRCSTKSQGVILSNGG